MGRWECTFTASGTEIRPIRHWWQQLLAFCVPGNPRTVSLAISVIRKAAPQITVTSTTLYAVVGNPNSAFGDLPFNAVNNNASLQPDYQMDEFNSIYNGLQTKFTHRMSHGLQVQAAYTWSHALDNAVDPLTPAVGARTFPRNSRDLAQSYGNSDNDTRHVGVFNYVWELPVGRGKSYLNNGAVGKDYGGLRV